MLMTLSLRTEVRMVKGVGPQRAELLAKRGIYTLEDLLAYWPFRYEDRIHFSNIRDIQPSGTYTIRARVMSGQAIPNKFSHNAIYHLLVQDSEGGLLPCSYFMAVISKAASSPASSSFFTAKSKSTSCAPRASK
jgi:RecG-like helicase